MNTLFKRMPNLVYIAFCVSVLSALIFPASGAELRLNADGSYRSLDIEGPIEVGDYSRFLQIAKENQAKLSGVNIYSPGGNFYEAMKIGRAMRKLEISSQVPMKGEDGLPRCDNLFGHKPRLPENCTAASAAFFIHIGGIHRGGTYLVVHRPTFQPAEFKELSEAEAKAAYDKLLADAKAYMEEMALPLQIQDIVLNTPSSGAVALDEASIRAYIWGDLPYRDEWRRAKCAKLTTTEMQRSREIGARMLQGHSLSADESAEKNRLRPLKDQEQKCEVALIEKSRYAAYERFFGVPPSDADGHKFEKWISAKTYIGRTFESVSEEERFEPGRTVASTSTLERKETATAPSITVMDLPDRRGVVAWVAVSKEDPDEGFKRRLESVLSDAWGAPTKEGAVSKWTAQEFHAKLSYEAGGGHEAAILVIEPKSANAP